MRMRTLLLSLSLLAVGVAHYIDFISGENYAGPVDNPQPAECPFAHWCNTAQCALDTDCHDGYQLCCGGVCALPAFLNESLARLPFGASCDASSPCNAICDHNLACISGFCEPVKDYGCACTQDGECYGICASSGQCVPDHLDAGDSCQDFRQCNSQNCTNGVCIPGPPAQENDYCTPYEVCGDNLYCELNDKRESVHDKFDASSYVHSAHVAARKTWDFPTGICKPKVAYGEACLPEVHHLTCHLRQGAVSGPSVVAGQVFDTNPCARDGACVQNVSSTACPATFVCWKGYPLGADCAVDKPCGGNGTCHLATGKCILKCSLEDGAPCSFDDECKSGCHHGICGAPVVASVPVGGACTNAAQCQGQAPACTAGKCVELAGRPCDPAYRYACGLGICGCPTNRSGGAVCREPFTCWREWGNLQAYTFENPWGGLPSPALQALEAELMCCLGCRGLLYDSAGVAAVTCSPAFGLTPVASLQCPVNASLPVLIGCNAYLGIPAPPPPPVSPPPSPPPSAPPLAPPSPPPAASPPAASPPSPTPGPPAAPAPAPAPPIAPAPAPPTASPPVAPPTPPPSPPSGPAPAPPIAPGPAPSPGPGPGPTTPSPAPPIAPAPAP